MTKQIEEPLMLLALYWDHDVGGFAFRFNEGLWSEGGGDLREAVSLGLLSLVENLRNNTRGVDTTIGEDVKVVYVSGGAVQ